MINTDFPGSLVVKTRLFECKEHGVQFLVGGAKIPHAAEQPPPKKKRGKEMVNIVGHL